MSILIKDMEMPKACIGKDGCPFAHFGACYGGKLERIMYVVDYTNSRHPECPLTEVPTSHGDLVDISVLPWYKITGKVRVGDKEFKEQTYMAIPMDDSLPVIIKGEE